MKIIPPVESKSIDKVEPGSLIHVPAGNHWCIVTEGEKIFSLSKHRKVTFNGLLMDFGKDYILSPDLKTAFRLAYPWECEQDISGCLCLYPESTPHVVLGATVTTLHVFDFAAGT